MWPSARVDDGFTENTGCTDGEANNNDNGDEICSSVDESATSN